MRERALGYVKRLLPYVVAGAIAAWVLRGHSLARIAAEMQRGDALSIVPAAATMIVLTWFLGATADFLLFAALHGRPGYRDVMRGRAASVVLELVSHGAAKGGYGTWLVRHFGLTLPSTFGLMLYVTAAELCSMCLITLTSVSIADVAVPPMVRRGSLAIAGALLAFILLGPSKILGDREWQAPWTRIPRPRALLSLGLRIAQHTTGLLCTIAAARAFGLSIPADVMVSLLPTVAVVGALPVNVGGVGAVQGAWLLFEPWAEAETILAFSILWGIAVAVMVVLRGLPFLGAVTAEIREARALHRAECASRAGETSS